MKKVSPLAWSGPEELEVIRLYKIINKPSHPNFYPIQIFPAKMQMLNVITSSTLSYRITVGYGIRVLGGNIPLDQ